MLLYLLFYPFVISFSFNESFGYRFEIKNKKNQHFPRLKPHRIGLDKSSHISSMETILAKDYSKGRETQEQLLTLVVRSCGSHWKIFGLSPASSLFAYLSFYYLTSVSCVFLDSKNEKLPSLMLVKECLNEKYKIKVCFLGLVKI